jgi:hypothetical protein
MDRLIAFRFPFLKAVSWALTLAIPALLFGGIPVFFVRPRSEYLSIVMGISILGIGIVMFAALARPSSTPALAYAGFAFIRGLARVDA